MLGVVLLVLISYSAVCFSRCEGMCYFCFCRIYYSTDFCFWILDGLYASIHVVLEASSGRLELEEEKKKHTCWRPHFRCHGNFYWSHLFFLGTFNGRSAWCLWKIDFHLSLHPICICGRDRKQHHCHRDVSTSPRTFCEEGTRESEARYWFALSGARGRSF